MVKNIELKRGKNKSTNSRQGLGDEVTPESLD